ncbi:PQQ-dependent sugar dehydrogenase [Algoriphagus aquatilis]|uniref:PQQ-dependent sugar dehydrogenase n=1 Tax=Algoriphagus aquatilis TaxID=490186 RepID=A0ABW0BRC6_9BACT|nr:sorbosone dehydrogenase family protein [Algoriphagus sp.]
MNSIKLLVLSLALGFLTLNASCQGKLSPVSTSSGSNKKDIRTAKADVKLDQIKLPAGFKISVWAADVTNARSMAISENGIVFVGNRQEKNVYALVDENADGKADYKFILAEGLRMPNGVAYKNGDLYVAEVNRILRFKDIKNNLTTPKYEVVYDGYPTDGHHGWKFIAFGPDGMLYVPVGAPCNICEKENPIYASITRLDVSKPGAKPEVYAHGVRNTVGFAWHPQSKELWFTDNGRDMMGDDVPDCELNRATAKGQHFGYPYWHAGTVKDPEFGSKGKEASAYVAPAAKMGAHTAPLGMRFYQGGMFPANFKNNAIIAKHGSWNRSKKSGYEVVLAKIDASGKVTGQEVFASGWLNPATQDVWGRPVDVQELPDGSLLISDDMANCIYRVTYSK